MKIAEILKENNNMEEQELDKLLVRMAKNTDPKITRFLFDNPLYRGTTPSNMWTVYFGVKKIVHNRKPKDMPYDIALMLSEFLKSKGFRAHRLNSIFVTGNYNLSLEYVLDENYSSYMIFPPKKFYFTWNRMIADFFIERLFHMKERFDIFKIDIKTFMQNRVLFSKFIEKHFSRTSVLLSKEVSEYASELASLYENKKYEEAEKLLKEFMNKSPSHYNHTVSTMYYTIEHNNENLRDLFYDINENSMIIKNFDNEKFEEAVLSGNEIMITDTEYFYIHPEYFEKNRNLIIKKLENYWSAMK